MKEEFKLLSTEETLKCIALAQKGDEQAKEKLLNGNYPLIKSIVKKYTSSKLDYDDLYQLGCMGFIKAIKNFSTSFGVKFSTYAVPMIAGEIKRYLRDDGEIKVSRSIKQLAIKINKYLEEVSQLEQEKPTPESLAKLFNAEPQDVVLALDYNYCLVSLYAKTADRSESSPNLIDKLGKVDAEDSQIEKIMLKKFIAELEPKEKKIILLRYFRGKTQTEIAKLLNVSQVQISRIEAKALQKLKKQMQ